MKTSVVKNTEIAEDVYLLRCLHPGFPFHPGQHAFLGLLNQEREYSIASSSADQCFLDFIFKVIPTGFLTPKLASLTPGSTISVRGPFGSFGKPGPERGSVRNVLIATGTGIAPYNSMATSLQSDNYVVIHGSTTVDSAYGSLFFEENRLIRCISQGGGDFHGRVTDYLNSASIAPGDLYYLCGNSDMIYEAREILITRGVAGAHIDTEVYF